MYDATLLLEKLEQIDEALEKIQRRFTSINSPDDFLDSDKGQDMLDGIAMMLIAIGENFKTIDTETEGKFLTQHSPDIHWSGVKGVRDVLSHQYFNIDAEEIFYICTNDLQPLRTVVQEMIKELKNGHTP
ncbi:MAG: DUF86 domain-containing protein [ANME-2 cluster archaeon]|nr:DUF86 domain-containing protein [ANME-2 cluster archaeon]MBC2706634.1 DUF86 domain-containing protein [ANME-2 cluster archaeon]MBC2746188.1 DUF86 domain-containing protein [ANME-2 cluster archaeon]MBC2762454.1 DUF86 domain-containing protein [ANME-2 cluster archaeon]